MHEHRSGTEPGRQISPLSIAVGAGVVVAGVLIVALVISPLLRPTPVEPTAPPRPTTAVSTATLVAAVSPATPTSAPATPTPVPTPAPTSAPSPSATVAPTGVTAVPASPTGGERYLGRDPLPAGVDLSNGPFLKDLKAKGFPGASTGDGSVGDELKAAYLEALKVEQQALNTGDDSRLRQHFTGEALTNLLRRTARVRASTSPTASAYEFKPLVMEFIPQTAKPGVYEIVDARTQSIATVERLPDGSHGKVIKPGETERACYGVHMQREGGSWKVEFEEARHDGPEGGKCPPFWS